MEESTSEALSTHGATPDLRIGSYRIIAAVGIGGTSSVFRAVHAETGHEVALKVLSRTLARNSTLLQRFLREARSAETLEHPNIVTIYDRGIDQGRHYLVLEYVAGGDLHEYVQRKGPLGVTEAISVVRDVAAGLKYAAARGLIHRDIKPSNILRTTAGQIKIIDLGLALQSGFEDERVTHEGTTVGTVDYMAPEQARDSRATSIQSDLYSLGCTFYYLLTGGPPFPGGDIIEKLTRHAKSAVPNVRDLRPDVHAGLASIIARMMAKRPEDRFSDYDHLIAALDGVSIESQDDGPGIALLPLDDEHDREVPTGSGDPWPKRVDGGSKECPPEAAPIPLQSLDDRDGPGGSRDPSPRRVDGGSEVQLPEAASIPLESLSDWAAELAGEGESGPTQPATVEASAPLPRLGITTGPDVQSDEIDGGESRYAIAPGGVRVSMAWILWATLISIALIPLAVGTFEFLVSSRASRPRDAAADHRAARRVVPPSIPRSPGAVVTGLSPEERPPNPGERRPPAETKPSGAGAELPWAEPEDEDPIRSVGDASFTGAAIIEKHLAEWARTPAPDPLGGPFVVVRRVSDSIDPATVPTLRMALDRFIGGTVELADEGPLPIDDLRVAGGSRLIRARPGFRPIVRIERSSSEVVRQNPAVCMLDRKNLTLDGIDLVVDVSDLTLRQTALFACAGSSLTLRNCSLTVLNPGNVPFTMIRAESSASRPARVRLERTFLRGEFTTALELEGGCAEVLVQRSIVVGGKGPLVRVARPDPASEQRLYVVDAIMAGPGPILEYAKESAGVRTKPLIVRAFGSAFGRFQTPGIASVIASTRFAVRVDREIDWNGDRNSFAGWKGFFACGRDRTITVADLAAVRSTWNGTDQDSQEILAPWPQPANLTRTAPGEFTPFVPNQSALLRQVAQPRAGLLEKTIMAYPVPAVPEPIGWAVENWFVQGAGSRRPSPFGPDVAKVHHGTTPGTQTASRRTTDANGILQLIWNTADPPWNGDLGLFLKDELTAGIRHARVHVVGMGSHRFTPVRLPPGLWLELRVETAAGVAAPSWSPEPEATGQALIELQGGALALSRLILRHDPASRLEHLIAVEDAHLILSHCQLLVPPPFGSLRGDLIAFRAPSTRPKSGDPAQPLFTVPVDRPACRLVDSILITGGTALRADLGRGLIAVSQSAIAAGDIAIELVPSRVARARFETDLILDQSTLASERTVVGLGPWPGLVPGPGRPWLITSRRCAFLPLSDRRAHETVLLRADADALARGTVFWQAGEDAAEVDLLTAVGEGQGPPSRKRDRQPYGAYFWGSNHLPGLPMNRMSGPRAAGNVPSVRLRERPRAGHLEPAHLILDTEYHPGRDRLTVGASLERQGITPKVAPPGQRRN